MRGRLAHRPLRVGAVDAVSLQAQPHPARAQGIVLARSDLVALMPVRGIHRVVDDGELALRAGAFARAHRHRIDLYQLPVFQQGQLPVGNADDDQPRVRVLRPLLRWFLRREPGCLLLGRNFVLSWFLF